MVLERSRLVIWLLVVFSLVAVLFAAWQPVLRELQRTTFEVANRRIIERANFYKREWLLRGKPQRSEVNGRWIHFSAHGWVYPRRSEAQQEHEVDCQALLMTLYPERRIVNQVPTISGTMLTDGYHCVFEYQGYNTIQIELDNQRFSSRVEAVP